MLLSLASSTKPHAVQKTTPQKASQLSEKMPGVLTDSITLKHPPRFGSRLALNHGIKYPIDLELAFEQSGQAHYAFLLKCIEMAANNDKSHIVFSTDMHDRAKEAPFPAPLKGLNDSLTMSHQPVDTLVEGYAQVEGLRLLQAATGKRYLNRHTTITLDQNDSHKGGRTKDARARVRLFNENQRDLEWLVMNRSGHTNRQVVSKFLQSSETINALTSLAFGKKGLADAIVVGHDHVLTRPALDKYYEAHDLSGTENRLKREAFNKEFTSLEKVGQWAKQEGLLESFNQFSPNSIAEKPSPLQKSVLDKDQSDTQKSDSEKTDSAKPKPTEQQKKMTDLIKQLNELVGNTITSKDKKIESKTRFHFHNEKFDKKGEIDLPRSFSMSKEGKTTVTEIQHIPVSLKNNTFIRDSIIFPAAFDFDTLPKLASALDKIYDKKEKLVKQGKSVSNALIVESSAGGYVVVLDHLKSKIESASIPTDVIVQGWGSSGGSVLLNAATGNRFATPNSSILLHEAGSGFIKDSLHKINKGLQTSEYNTSAYQHLIADKTGRPFKEVCKDFKIDFEVNPVESILYGKKGLIDAILVGPNKVLTRDAVMDFIIEKKGSAEAAQHYVDEKFIQRREGQYSAHLDQHKSIDEDPLANPLQVIHELVQQGKAVPMSSIDRFKASLSDVAGQTDRSMHLYKIAAKPPTPEPAKK